MKQGRAKTTKIKQSNLTRYSMVTNNYKYNSNYGAKSTTVIINIFVRCLNIITYTSITKMFSSKVGTIATLI